MTGRVKLIFLVQATHGEDSDRSEWVVCAYSREDLAQDHVRKAKDWVQQNMTHDRWYDLSSNDSSVNPYDKDVYGAHPDTEWFICEAELRASLPKLAKIARAAITKGG